MLKRADKRVRDVESERVNAVKSTSSIAVEFRRTSSTVKYCLAARPKPKTSYLCLGIAYLAEIA
jgi:hypothetical protein